MCVKKSGNPLDFLIPNGAGVGGRLHISNHTEDIRPIGFCQQSWSLVEPIADGHPAVPDDEDDIFSFITHMQHGRALHARFHLEESLPLYIKA